MSIVLFNVYSDLVQGLMMFSRGPAASVSILRWVRREKREERRAEEAQVKALGERFLLIGMVESHVLDLA